MKYLTLLVFLVAAFSAQAVEPVDFAKQAQLVRENAEKKCLGNKNLLTTICLKNLQLQAIEKKIGILEKTVKEVNISQLAPAIKKKNLQELMQEISAETKYLSDYRERGFDGLEAFELEMKDLLIKTSDLKKIQTKI